MGQDTTTNCPGRRSAIHSACSLVSCLAHIDRRQAQDPSTLFSTAQQGRELNWAVFEGLLVACTKHEQAGWHESSGAALTILLREGSVGCLLLGPALGVGHAEGKVLSASSRPGGRAALMMGPVRRHWAGTGVRLSSGVAGAVGHRVEMDMGPALNCRDHRQRKIGCPTLTFVHCGCRS